MDGKYDPFRDERIVKLESRIAKFGDVLSLRNNLTADRAPLITDDVDDDYGPGSTWIYSGTTYTCTDNTLNAAVWVTASDIIYFNTWAELIAAISVTGSTYVNKYASVANANGGPISGVTYVAPAAIGSSIVDGGGATYKVLAQGTNYSVIAQPRTVTNPVVTKVMLTAAAKPTAPGYYIFTVIPTNGLPAGVQLNDIAYLENGHWACYQVYSAAMAVLVAGTTANTQVTWRKFNGTWMSTADDYIPDGNEYQTGKLYNGKAVYRKCSSGTTNASIGQYNTSISVSNIETMILTGGTIHRATGTRITIPFNTFWYAVLSSGVVVYESTETGNSSRPYVVWVEYTKS